MTMTNCNCECDNAIEMLNLKGPQFGIDKNELKKLIQEITGGSSSGGTGSGDQIIPDLQIGMETKMPMRYMGKQVYGTLIDFGALPNTAHKEIAHGLTDIDWYKVDDTMSHVTMSGERHSSPNFPHTTTITGCWSITMDKQNLILATGMNRLAYKAVICVLYTKASESASAAE